MHHDYIKKSSYSTVVLVSWYITHTLLWYLNLITQLANMIPKLMILLSLGRKIIVVYTYLVTLITTMLIFSLL